MFQVAPTTERGRRSYGILNRRAIPAAYVQDQAFNIALSSPFHRSLHSLYPACSQARRDNLKINDRWFSLEIPIRAVNYHPPPLNHLSPAYHANPVVDEEVRSASRSFDTGVSCLPHDLIGYTRFNPLTKALPPPRSCRADEPWSSSHTAPNQEISTIPNAVYQTYHPSKVERTSRCHRG